MTAALCGGGRRSGEFGVGVKREPATSKAGRRVFGFSSLGLWEGGRRRSGWSCKTKSGEREAREAPDGKHSLGAHKSGFVLLSALKPRRDDLVDAKAIKVGEELKVSYPGFLKQKEDSKEKEKRGRPR